MYSLFRKEITSFFGSLTGYLIAVVFLLANGLFLWVFPGNYNILENGYASLNSYFSLAPWIFLFLIPALTMRLFAEEKRLGTLEILVTRPLSLFQLVWSKYLAGVVLVIICLLPTLIYFYSVYALGNPVGNWDSGAAWGSFIGLFLLAALYVSIGLLASVLTDNQIFAFVVSLFLSFFFYTGFDFIASTNLPLSLSEFLLNIGINEHYLSVSRGVVDSRDLIYFISVTFFMLVLTSMFLQQKQKSFKAQLKKILALFVALIGLFIISQNIFFRIDLTTEKRYSLSPVSKELLNDLEAPVMVDFFLAGDLPAGFRNLQKAVEEKIQDINAYSDYRVYYQLTNPYDFSAEDRNDLFDQLVNMGLQPTDVRRTTDEGTSTSLIFPGAVITYKDISIGVNLLKNNISLAAETNWNNSIETLEYEIMRALQMLMGKQKDEVVFLSGQDELSEAETYSIRLALAENYSVKDRTAEEILQLDTLPKALIIADPQIAFKEKDKFYIDQYLMRGGNIMWLVDPVQVSLDSLSMGESTIAFPKDLNLNDQLFRYGIRINTDLIQDADCIQIPVNSSVGGNSAGYISASWYYSPLLYPSDSHVIGRDLTQLKSEFVSSIDTVGNDPAVQKSILLHSSDYSRVEVTPMEVSLQIIDTPVSNSYFNQKQVPVGALLEGTFSSVFKNRMIDEFNTLGIEPLSKSSPARMIVLADGSIIANKVSNRNGQIQTLPVGYDDYSQTTFGNKEFLVNAVNYLCDDTGIMSLRSRVFKIRLLDKVQINEDKLFWQLLNTLFPLVLIAILGLIFNFLRIKKYRD